MQYGFPGEMVASWRKEMGDRLLPLQEQAVRRHKLFDGGNLLVQAPTSAGKTFVGEMAAVQTALRRKRAVYLAPLKALAEEKYREFSAKYADYGLKVIVSSRDHRDHDAEFARGDYAIAVVVYEKLSQLLVQRPEQLAEIDLVVADELELLSDPERGPGVELLLTQVLRGGCRVVGLSAVIGEPERIADWMNGELLQYGQRPIELRYGVLHEGVFRYRTYNDLDEGEEAMVDSPADSSWRQLVDTVCACAERGETCLVFVKSRRESRRGAEQIAAQLSAPSAKVAVSALETMEQTCSMCTLRETLQSGVAFHNADLTADERRVIEEAFRTGDIRVLVATSTLAAGMNLPAQNTFIAEDKWRFDPQAGAPWKAPISKAEYENMGGRAGRFGAGYAFGRSILMAATPFDFESLWRRYVEGDREAVQPQLFNHPLEDTVLSLVASRVARRSDELVHVLENTLSGRRAWRERLTADEVHTRVRAAMHRAVDAGMLREEPNGTLIVTPLGHAVTAKGISIATARDLERWVSQSETRPWHDLDPILAAALTPDARLSFVGMTALEFDEAAYPKRLKRATHEADDRADVPLRRIRHATVAPFFEEVRAIKSVLMIRDWIDHVPLRDIEESYATMAGQVIAAADQLSWLLDAMAAIAEAAGANEAFVERLEVLSFRVQRGLREEAVPLGRVREPGLSRTAIAALVDHRLSSPQALRAASLAQLEQWIPAGDAVALKRWAAHHVHPAQPGGDSPPQLVGDPYLIVDDRRPAEIVLAGKTIELQEKQFRLLRALAERAGECVSYDTIYNALWDDGVFVEQNQIHVQKAELMKRLRQANPAHRNLIKAVPRHGFKLMLAPDAVAVNLAATVGAA